MSRWSDASSWVGDGIRREVFFFESAGERLYGSLYAPAASSPPFGVLFCNSWGYEGDQGNRFIHPAGLAAAEAGVAAAGFQYAGFGDSGGDLERATMDDLTTAALDALAEVSRRSPGTAWILTGLMLGASVAALATARGARAERLLMVQPALRPGRYFARLRRVAQRAAAGSADGEGHAFGYPLPASMLESAAAADAAVERALKDFGGEGTVVRYEVPERIEGVPERFEDICAPGAWRFGSQDLNHRDPALVSATLQWLRRRTAAVAAR